MSDGGVRRQLQALLDQHGLAANRRLGQHFMVDRSAIEAIVDGLDAVPRRVVEIGPGTGLLTAALLEAEHEVLAVELDAGMVRLLRSRFDGCQALRLEHGDALAGKNDLHPAIVDWAAAGPWSLAANLPYDASLPILLNALQQERAPDRIVVTVQAEAAQRLCASPGSKAWGATAAVAQAAGHGRILRRLPPQCFHPRPRVDSAILQWTVAGPIPVGFSVWCRRLFAYRRKVLPRGLRDAGIDRGVANTLPARLDLPAAVRVEQLSVDSLLALYRLLKEDGHV